MSANTLSQRFTQVLQNAATIEFDNATRLILFSDAHRGINDWADDFAPNQLLYFYALQYYYQEGFTCFELGDSDELWENLNFADIKRAHSHIFWLLSQFYQEGRYHLLFGNHTMIWKDPQRAAEDLGSYYNDRTHTPMALFPEIKVHEGLKLHHTDSGVEIFLIHGHQGDFFNDQGWPLSRLLVRTVWRSLQILALHDPTSPAQNYHKQNVVENWILQWLNQQPAHLHLICGHTHRPAFPDPGDPLYFNIGSAVHPRAVTGIEIQQGEIRLIKWWITPDNSGALHVSREVLAGPHRLEKLQK